MLRHLLVCSALAASLASVACTSTSTTAPEGASSAQAATIAMPAIAPNEWARCWVETTVATTGPVGASPSYQRLACKASEQPATLRGPSNHAPPFKLGRVTLTVATADGDSNDYTLGSLISGKRVSADSFPLTLDFTVSPEGLGIAGDLTAHFTIAAPAAATVDAPLLVMRPFAIWPVAVVERPRNADDTFMCSIQDYATSPPFATTIHNDIEQLWPSSDRNKVYYTAFAAPASGSITVKYMVNWDLTSHIPELQADAIIDGPGVYIASPQGFRKANDTDRLPPELTTP